MEVHVTTNRQRLSQAPSWSALEICVLDPEPPGSLSANGCEDDQEPALLCVSPAALHTQDEDEETPELSDTDESESEDTDVDLPLSPIPEEDEDDTDVEDDLFLPVRPVDYSAQVAASVLWLPSSEPLDAPSLTKELATEGVSTQTFSFQRVPFGLSSDEYAQALEDWSSDDDLPELVYTPSLQASDPESGIAAIGACYWCPKCRESGQNHKFWCPDVRGHDASRGQGSVMEPEDAVPPENHAERVKVEPVDLVEFGEATAGAFARENDRSTETVEEKDEGSVNCIGVTNANRKAYALGRVLNTSQGVQKPVKIMVDNGNTTPGGVIISEPFRQRMQLKFSKILPGRIPTAGKGQAMNRLGYTETFCIKFDGMPKTFKVKALVCQELSDEMNVGTGWLCSLSNGQNCVPTLRFFPQGPEYSFDEIFADGWSKKQHGVPLVQTVKGEQEEPPALSEEFATEPEKSGPTVDRDSGIDTDGDDPPVGQGSDMEPEVPEPPVSRRPRVRPGPEDHKRPDSVGARVRHAVPLFAKDDVVLAANSVNFVKTVKMPATTLVEPVNIPGSHARAVPGVYRHQNRIAILNLADEKVTLKKGVQIGSATPLKRNALPAADVPPEVRDIRPEDDLQQLFKDLQLDENELLIPRPAFMRKVKAIIAEFADVFASPDAPYGRTDLIEFNITLAEGAKPKKARVRPLNPKQKASLKAQLDLWKREDIIEDSDSPWASALVAVQKKNGETRWAVDYRPINEVTVKDSYPLPNIAENLDKLEGSRIFSTLDAAGAYHTIPVGEKTKPLLAFISPFGLFQFKGMPFGAANAGQVYSRFVDMLVTKLRSPWVLAYVDDFILHTPDLATHLSELRRVLQLHREAGVKLNAKKTKLFQKEADYLGYRVAEDGIHMTDKFVKKVLDWPAPKTVKELASFLGFASYYRTFIPQFAALTAEMSAQKKQKVLVWTDEMQQKFEMLKGLFAKKPIRAYPRYGEDEAPFEVWPDFSALALGGVLQQVQDGQLRLIAAGGRKTTKGESNYAPTKGELAAIIHQLRKFEHILRYKPFVIYTDHSPLKWLRSIKNPRGIFFRWLQELESYDFEVRHVAGKDTGAADGLSRSTHLRDPTPEEVAESEEYVGHVGAMGDPNDPEAVQMNRVSIREAQLQDYTLKLVRKWVKGNPPKDKQEIRALPEDARVYHQHLKLLTLDEGDTLVMKSLSKFQGDDPPPRILIPEGREMREEVFQWSHAHPSAGHFGTNATCLRAVQKFYWPGMSGEMRRGVKRCDLCLAKITKVNTHQAKHQPRQHGFPGEVLYVDLVGPLPRTDGGKAYICTMQDGFTRYVTATTIQNKYAETVAGAVLDSFITKFGCPTRIHSDQGSEFRNNLWTGLMDRLQIKKTETPTYNPHSNLVERFHRSLNQILRVHMSREDRSWERFVPMACFAYNTKINATTGISPFEAWMGRKAKMPIDLVVPLPDKIYRNQDDYVQEVVRRFNAMFHRIKTNTETTFARNARLYVGSAAEYKVNDLVWLFSKRKVPGKPLKITDGWTGPYRVVGIPADVILELTPAETAGSTFAAHITRVRPFSGDQREQKYRPPKEPLADIDADELAEEVGQPEQWKEPTDNLRIPIRTDEEPPGMRDIIQPPPVPPAPITPAAAAAPAVARPGPPVPAPAGAEGGARRKSPPDMERVNPEKRKRAGPQPALEPSSKDPRIQGSKRDREEAQPEWAKSTRRRQAHWRDIVLPDTDDSMETSDEGAVDQIAPQSVLTVQIPPGTSPPTQGTADAAGWDCRSNQTLTIEPGQTARVDLGLRVALPTGWCMLLHSRSKLASEGVTVEAGLIDPDYRGPILCVLHNHTHTPRRIQKGERICQALIVPVPRVKWQTVTELDATPRGADGFGSSGSL
jgi:deoxyuridine 5'-triphosphate nucleotidohydrolase